MSSEKEREKEKTMVAGDHVDVLPLTFLVHLLAIPAIVMVLVWSIHFRGGLSWNSSNKSLIFNIHPVLMLIGIIITGGEAIISYKALPFKKKIKKSIHLGLHATALILGIIGIYAVFKFHNEMGIVNLYSLHSWLGIGVIVLYGIQWIFGFVMFIYYHGVKSSLKSSTLHLHVKMGLFVYVLAVATASLGFLEKLTFMQTSGLSKHGSEAILVNFTAIITIFYAASVVFSAVSPSSTTPHH